MIPAPLRHRFDDWTPDRQRGFIAALAETRSVTRAVARMGMSARSGYRLREHPAAADFRRVWDATLAFRPPPQAPSLLTRVEKGTSDAIERWQALHPPPPDRTGTVDWIARTRRPAGNQDRDMDGSTDRRSRGSGGRSAAL